MSDVILGVVLRVNPITICRFTRYGGFALIVDYGHSGKRLTPSLRAYKQHKLVSPLETPGETDLTADVDFGVMREALAGDCLVFGPVDQR